MKKDKNILWFILAIILGVALTSCMSEVQRKLQKSVEEYAASLPQKISGIATITSTDYSSNDNVVTIDCEVESGVVAATVEHTSDALKTAYIAYLKKAIKTDPVISDIVDADASLRCRYWHDGKQIAEFTVTAKEISGK